MSIVRRRFVLMIVLAVAMIGTVLIANAERSQVFNTTFRSKTLFFDGMIAALNLQYENAIDKYDEVIGLQHHDKEFVARVYAKRGEAYSKSFDFEEVTYQYEEALMSYQQAEQLNPEFVSKLDNFHYVQAEVHRKKDNIQKAIESISRAIAINPRNAYYRELRAQLLSLSTGSKLTDNEYGDAIKAYSEAIQLKNQKSNDYWTIRLERESGWRLRLERKDTAAFVYQARGSVYAHPEVGDYQSAIEDFTKAIELEPEDAFHYGSRGWAYFSEGKYEEAVKDFTKAIELEPEDASNYSSLGTAYSQQRKYQEAVKNLNQTIQLLSEQARQLKNQSETQLSQEEQQANTEEIGSVNKRLASRHILRGSSYLRQKNFEQSRKDFERAIELEPDSLTKFLYRSNLGWVYLESGDYQRAIQEFQQVLKNISGYGKYDAMYGLGKVHSKRGDYQTAIEHYNQVLPEEIIYGIGIPSKFDLEVRKPRILALTPIPNTPARQAGLRVGDIISEIDDVDTTNMSAEDVITRLRGEEDSKVTLRIIHESRDIFTKNLTRVPLVPDGSYPIEVFFELAEVYEDRGYAREKLGDNQGANKDLKIAASLFLMNQDDMSYKRIQDAIEDLSQ